MSEDIEKIKIAVSDTMSGLYHELLKKRFDAVDKKITDLRLTNEALVKIVDYTRLEARVIELEDRLKRLESKK